MKRLCTLLIFFAMNIAPSFGQAVAPMTLQDCINTALKNNSSLRIEEQRLESAATNVTDAYSDVLPTLNTSFSSGVRYSGASVYKKLTNVFDPVTLTPKLDPITGNPIQEEVTIYQKSQQVKSHSASASLNQTIFNLGSLYNIKAAKLAEQAADHSVKNTRLAVILSVKEAYYELLKANRLKAVYDEAVKLAEEELVDAQARLDIGISSQAEVFQAKVNLGTQRTSALNQENVVEMGKANLNNAMARDTNLPVEIIEDQSDPIFPTLTFDEAARISLENNQALKELGLNVKTSFYNIKQAQTRYLPTVGGYLSYNRNNDDIGRVYSTGLDKDYSASLGASLNLNLFNGFSDKAGVQRATINHRIAQETYNENQRNVLASVKQYFLQLEAYKDIIEINKQNIEAAQENLRLQLEKRRVGAGTELEVTQAQTELTRAQANYVNAEYNAKIAGAQLEMVMGVASLPQ